MRTSPARFESLTHDSDARTDSRVRLPIDAVVRRHPDLESLLLAHTLMVCRKISS